MAERGRGLIAAGLLALAAAVAPALAEAPERSPRPQANPARVAAPVAAPVATPAAVAVAGGGATLAPDRALRPAARPARADAAAAAAVAPAAASEAPAAPVATAPAPRKAGFLAGLLRPRARPEGVEPAALRVPPSKAPVASKRGSVCGVPEIRGEKLAPITSRVKGCGVTEPVRVTEVAGVRLSQAATMDCPTALALRDWIEAGVRPAFGRSEVVELMIAAHYICRTRNNRKGAKISEHGRGRAIDVAGFVLADGTELSIARNYTRPVRAAHKAACGIFGTTLGPGSDGFHEDHLHFDTARHRNGPYCR